MSVAAIQTVSEAIGKILKANMETEVDIVFSRPVDSQNGNTEPTEISLFLYRVEENPHFRNDAWEEVSPQIKKPPPLSLKLHYLLIPYSSGDDLGVHLLLGDAMRVFHEHQVIDSQYLPELENSLIQQIEIVPELLTMEELGRVWNPLDASYRLSVGYEVSVVQIASSLSKRRVSRVQEDGVRLSVVQTGEPPSIESVTPESGPVGTEVELAGYNFDGRYIEVTVSGKTVDSVQIGSASLATFQIPDGLEAGYNQIVIIVNGRRSNSIDFVVTPYLRTVNPREGTFNTVTEVQLFGEWNRADLSQVILYAPGLPPDPQPHTSIPDSDGISFQLDPGAVAGAYDISVTDNNGNESNREPFFATPYIDVIEPRRGIEGAKVALHGRGLNDGTVSVSFGTASLTPSYQADNMIEFRVPEGLTADDYEVSVNVDWLRSNVLIFTLRSVD